MSATGRNPLAPLLIVALRDLREARADAAQYREVLCLLLGMHAETVRQLEASRRHAIGLRNELRHRSSARASGVAA